MPNIQQKGTFRQTLDGSIAALGEKEMRLPKPPQQRRLPLRLIEMTTSRHKTIRTTQQRLSNNLYNSSDPASAVAS